MARTLEQLDTDLAALETKLSAITGNPGFFPPLTPNQLVADEDIENE